MVAASFTSPQWILEQLAKWFGSFKNTPMEEVNEELMNDKSWLIFVNYIDKKVLKENEKVTPQQWFDYRESLALLDQARIRGDLASHIPQPKPSKPPELFEGQVEEDDLDKVLYEATSKDVESYPSHPSHPSHPEVIEEAERLINPKTLLEKYKAALRLQNYEEAGKLWKQMSAPEQEEARKLATHRRTIRKLAFNDMLGKGWDSGKQYSYCMQRSLAGDPQFWWVPEVIRKFPMPPPNWEAVSREPDGRFREFPGRGKGKRKKEKKSSARAQLCKFALNLYFNHHTEEGRRILSLLREIK